MEIRAYNTNKKPYGIGWVFMNYENAKTYLAKIGQSQLLQYYDELDETERVQLLSDIEKTNFKVVENIGKNEGEFKGEISPINAISLDEIKANSKKYEEVGIRALKEKKVGAVLLAGGQGTRLGFDKPKGMFNIGVTRELSIFEQQMNNIKEVTNKTKVYFPIFVMTSVKNDEDTRKFFAEKNYFGYPKNRVFFFVQKTEPACDFNGKVYLEEKNRVSLSPNGNGGWYSSLMESECAKVVVGEGIEWLNIYAVDNVLQRICDPQFIGATLLSGVMCGAKVVKKACASEKVGVLCKQDGKPSIVEYYEMPDELKELKDDKGELVYRFGVILNYLFNVKKLNEIVNSKLPYHLAKKAVPHIENGVKVKPDAPCGYKFETLVVDMVKLMDTCLAYEVDRSKEFAPVKNKEGVDSVDTARALLKQNGVEI